MSDEETEPTIAALTQKFHQDYYGGILEIDTSYPKRVPTAETDGAGGLEMFEKEFT